MKFVACNVRSIVFFSILGALFVIAHLYKCIETRSLIVMVEPGQRPRQPFDGNVRHSEQSVEEESGRRSPLTADLGIINRDNDSLSISYRRRAVVGSVLGLRVMLHRT